MAQEEKIAVTISRPDAGMVFKKINTVTNEQGEETNEPQFATALNGVNTSGWQEVPIAEYEAYKAEQERKEFEEFQKQRGG